MSNRFLVPQSTPILTSLPGSPDDGMEIRYLADATAGIVWQLRYRAGSASSYKWEFLGGRGLRAQTGSIQTVLSAGLTTFTALSPSVSITAPLAGDYDIEYGGDILNNSSGNAVKGRLAVFIAAAQAAMLHGDLSPTVVGEGVSVFGRHYQTAMAASAVVDLRGASNGLNISIDRPALRITPVRVG